MEEKILPSNWRWMLTRVSYSCRRLVADKPFPAVKAIDTAAARLIHPWFDRYLLMPELLRAQSR